MSEGVNGDLLRRLSDLLSEAGSAASRAGASFVEDVVQELEHGISKIRGKSEASVQALLAHTFDQIDRWRENKGRPTGVGTDYFDLDDMTGGFQPGNLIVIGGRPSMGKTSLALNICQRVAEQGTAVAFFSLEMAANQVVQNILCCRAKLDGQAMRKGRITEKQFVRLQEEAEWLYQTPIHIDDKASSLRKIENKARKLVAGQNVGIIVVDSLQLMSDTGRFPDRYAEQAAIVVGLKALAHDLCIPIMVVSALNRGVESRDDYQPRLTDLRDCGAIEDVADVVLMLHREDYYRPTTENLGLALVTIAKQRNGPVGTVVLRFFREWMRFENYTKATGA